MGTDIHLLVERQDANGNWDKVPPPHCMDKYAEKSISPLPITELYSLDKLGEHPFYKYCDDAHARLSYRECWYHSRNYYVFGVLAGVRGHGPAISQPRGLPTLGRASQILADEMWLGDHSFSWLTLRELLTYRWNAKEARDFVSEFLPELKKLGDPDKIRIVFGFDS